MLVDWNRKAPVPLSKLEVCSLPSGMKSLSTRFCTKLAICSLTDSVSANSPFSFRTSPPKLRITGYATDSQPKLASMGK